MTQRHIEQHGIFHITTVSAKRTPWCTLPGIPNVLIDNLRMTRSMQDAKLHAFCVLPNHLHFLIDTNQNGLSKFMHSFKKNSSQDLANLFPNCPYKWQKGYHDERIRDERQFFDALSYIQYNAWRHGLCAQPEDWPWSSLKFPSIADSLEQLLG